MYMIARDPFDIGKSPFIDINCFYLSNQITREFKKISKLFTRNIAELWETRNSGNNIYVFQQSETGDGAKVVHKFWPNFRLAVLIKAVLIKKR